MQNRGRRLSAPGHPIFEIDFPDKGGFERQNIAIFARRHPSPGNPAALRNGRRGSCLHDDSSFPDYAKQTACPAGGFGIIVWMIFIFAPHTGQVMVGRFLCFLRNILSGLTRSTICKNRMSFLLQG